MMFDHSRPTPDSASSAPERQSDSGVEQSSGWFADNGLEVRKILPSPDGHRARAVPPGESDHTTVRPERYDRIWTIPNVLSMLRIALIPVYVWMIVGLEEYSWALGIVILSTVTDWLDGKIARIWALTTRLGHYLDPIADRLLIIVTPFALAAVDIVPWWLVAVLVARDLILAPTMLIYRRYRVRPDSTYLGKAATFALMWAFPCLLVAHTHWAVATYFEPWARALLVWGAVLYLWTGAIYVYRSLLVRNRYRKETG